MRVILEQGGNMRSLFIVILFILPAFFNALSAETELNGLVVYSSEESNGSVATNIKWGYTKNLLVAVGNMNNYAVDLSKLCFKAFSPENKQFELDTIDVKLVKGMLKSKEIIKGTIVFYSNETDIHKSVLIKISGNCTTTKKFY